MEIIVFLSIVIAVVAVLTSIVLVRRVKKQIAEMTDALVDVKNGNGNRRILSATNELTAPLAYEINEIVVSYESRLSIVRQTEETNRQLMTSLSHDVRTPLTTLIGYLDAAHKGLVTGKDRDDYIESARRKAHDLKEYIDVLFDWFKLNSNEFALEIQSVEAAELTRNILIDWIPIFEDKQVDYDIDIPEQPIRVRLDTDSYMRIVNNLIDFIGKRCCQFICCRQNTPVAISVFHINQHIGHFCDLFFYAPNENDGSQHSHNSNHNGQENDDFHIGYTSLLKR